MDSFGQAFSAGLLIRNFHIIAVIIQYVASIIGVALIAGGIFQLKKYGEMRSMMSHQMTLAGPLVTIIAGSALLVLPTVINLSILTFFGSDSPLQYDTGSSYTIEPVIIFVRVIGLAAFVRGLVILAKAGHQQGQPGTLGRALVHILGGAACIHVLGLYELLVSIFV